jgi:predicted Zn-dependent peptidase
MYERTALPDGLRVISARVPGARSFSIAAFVLAGTRHERTEDAGIAHFMEHLTFKGTAAYPTTRAVSEAIEGVGGGCNAATDRESTVYWARVPAKETDRAVGVLGELIARPRLDPTEVEREKDVIVEEIRSYVDDPSEYAGILFDRAMFGDGPLGREIAGDEASVRGLTPAAIEAFWRARYRPDAIVVSAVGDVAHDDVVDRVAAAFAPAGDGGGRAAGHDEPAGGAEPPAAFAPEPAPALPAGARVLADRRETSQVQLSVGVPALRRDHPDQWTLEVLNGILGEGMSSRLFLTVREERGLAYDVDSYIVDFADAGALVVRAGVDPRNVRRALRAILAELARLRDEDVPADELRKAQGYLCGRLELRLEETRHLASWLGAQEALHARVHTLEEAVEEIRGVEPAAIRRLAGELFRDDGLRLALVAPRGSARDIGSALTFDGGPR